MGDTPWLCVVCPALLVNGPPDVGVEAEVSKSRPTTGFSRAERASKPCAFQQLVLRARARQRRVVAARSASAASPGWVAPQAKPHVTEALDTRSVGWCNYHGHSGLGFWKNASAAFSVQSYAMVNHLPVWRKYDRSKGLWCMNR